MLAAGYIEHPLNYRFARNDSLACWTLEYLCAGHINVQSVQGRQLYQTASVMMVPPRTPYAVEWAGGAGEWKELYFVFDPLPHWMPLLSWPAGDCGLGLLDLPHPAIAREVESALDAVLQMRKSARANREALALNALERALWILDEVNPARGYRQRDARIEEALAYIAQHYAKRLDLASLARQVFLSPSRFSHLFKAQTGQAPLQYVEQYRLERAAERLLSSHDSVEQIAASVGFANAFHFSTRFRRHFGRPPGRYRLNPKELGGA